MSSPYSGFAGIDPGKEGALALLSVDGSYAQVLNHPMVRPKGGRPDYNLADIIARLRWLKGDGPPPLVALERLHAMGHFASGTIAAYERGRSDGWRWALMALDIPHVLVRAQQWQGDLGLVRPKVATITPADLVDRWDPKKASIARATERFGAGLLLRTPKSSVPHDGRADALNLADWCRLYGQFWPASGWTLAPQVAGQV